MATATTDTKITNKIVTFMFFAASKVGAKLRQLSSRVADLSPASRRRSNSKLLSELVCKNALRVIAIKIAKINPITKTIISTIFILYDVFMDKTKWIIFSVVVIALFGFLIWSNRSETPKFTGDASKIITDAPIADHFTGPEDQKVVLIEYGDYQCPACGQIYTTVKQLEATYPDKLTF